MHYRFQCWGEAMAHKAAEEGPRCICCDSLVEGELHLIDGQPYCEECFADIRANES